MTYIRSLDGLRGIAIALVMLSHFGSLVECGWVGVPLFFVLSGFLITRLLLDAKARAPSFVAYLGGFELRRVLRIFPLYFGFLGVVLVAYLATRHPTIAPRFLPWAATYTLNFGLAFGRLPLDPLYAHFWSLAVEEQFYLAWPFIVWLAPTKTLRRIVVLLIVAAPIARLVAGACGFTPMQIYLATPSHLDALACGAAVAVFDLSSVRRPARLALGVGVATLAAGLASHSLSASASGITSLGYPETLPFHYAYVWGYTLLDLFAATLVLACVRGDLPRLEAAPLVGIGTISYGLYVLSRPVLACLLHVEPRVVATIPEATLRTALGFVAYVASSLVLARLSFELLESPIRNLGARFVRAPEAESGPESSRFAQRIAGPSHRDRASRFR